MRSVSLFTGCGGLDLGLEAAGFETSVAVELDPHAVQTLRHNTNWHIFDEDIHEVKSEDILAAAGCREGEVDLLAGGPPCQPFSKSGYWATGDAGRLDDPRASTLEAYLRVLRDIKPRAFLLENVPGLAYKGKSEGLDLLRKTVASINRQAGTSYNVSFQVLNAAEYGVPQQRERIFIVGSREGLELEFPSPTHTLPASQMSLGDTQLEAFHTAWDAIGDLEGEKITDDLMVGGRWADLLPSIPEGSNYLHHTDRGEGLPLFGWRRRYWSFLLKLAKDLPSWTLTAQPGSAIGPFHWKNRRLSVREMCRLQTIPDHFEVQGSYRAAQRQIGNAVPSALAEVLGTAIRQQLLGQSCSPKKRKLLPVRSKVTPGATPLSPVPEKYRELSGNHSPHPGTGKGYSAQERSSAAVAT